MGQNIIGAISSRSGVAKIQSVCQIPPAEPNHPAPPLPPWCRCNIKPEIWETQVWEPPLPAWAFLQMKNSAPDQLEHRLALGSPISQASDLLLHETIRSGAFSLHCEMKSNFDTLKGTVIQNCHPPVRSNHQTLPHLQDLPIGVILILQIRKLSVAKCVCLAKVRKQAWEYPSYSPVLPAPPPWDSNQICWEGSEAGNFFSWQFL